MPYIDSYQVVGNYGGFAPAWGQQQQLANNAVLEANRQAAQNFQFADTVARSEAAALHQRDQEAIEQSRYFDQLERDRERARISGQRYQDEQTLLRAQGKLAQDEFQLKKDRFRAEEKMAVEDLESDTKTEGAVGNFWASSVRDAQEQFTTALREAEAAKREALRVQDEMKAKQYQFKKWDMQPNQVTPDPALEQKYRNVVSDFERAQNELNLAGQIRREVHQNSARSGFYPFPGSNGVTARRSGTVYRPVIPEASAPPPQSGYSRIVDYFKVRTSPAARQNTLDVALRSDPPILSPAQAAQLRLDYGLR